MTTETKDLHEKRGKLITEMQNILSKAKKEERTLTKEESDLWDKLDSQAEGINDDIKRVEKINELSATEQERLLNVAKENKNSPDEETDKTKFYEKSWIKWVKGGIHSLTDKERMSLIDKKRAYQNVGTTTEGGFLVPEGFQPELAKALLKFGGVREVARILRTASGNDIPWPNMNDTANSASILSESNAASTTPDLVFGSTTLKAWMYVTSVIRASYQLLQDSAIDVRSIIIDALAERIGRGTNAGFTTGNGTTAPEGVVTGSGLGATTASETAITATEIMDLEHSVDASYRPNAKFMMHDSVLKALKKLTVGTSDDTPLWNPGIIQAGTPSTILGYPYVINNNMASSIVADAKTILFGDFSYYIVRDILDFSILNLKERYAEYLQEGFIGFSRHDGRYISSYSTVKHLIQVNT